MRSVTDRTGQAQLTSNKTPLNPAEKHQRSSGVGRALGKNPVDPTETAENQRYEYDYSTNRDPEISRPEEGFRRTPKPTGPQSYAK